MRTARHNVPPCGCSLIERRGQKKKNVDKERVGEQGEKEGRKGYTEDRCNGNCHPINPEAKFVREFQVVALTYLKARYTRVSAHHYFVVEVRVITPSTLLATLFCLGIFNEGQ